MQRILVTGGSGFIGRHFCASAFDRGKDVWVLTRNIRNARHHLPCGIQLVTRLEDIPESTRIDVVVNLSGERLFGRRWNSALKEKFYQSRVGLTNDLYTYFSQQKNKPRLLISGSAVGYYGSQGEQVLAEDAFPQDCFSHRLCLAWEQAATQFKSLNTRVCHLRTGIVLGKDGGAIAGMLLPFKLGLGGTMGRGDQWMSWIHIDDMVNLVFHLIEREELKGSFNASAPTPVTNREFTHAMADVLHRPAFFQQPAFALKLLFGESAQELLLSGQRVIPRKFLDSGFTFRYPELDEALTAILA